MLQAEGNPHNGDAEQTAKKRGFNGERQPGNEDPDDIQQQGTGSSAVPDLLPTLGKVREGQSFFITFFYLCMKVMLI